MHMSVLLKILFGEWAAAEGWASIKLLHNPYSWYDPESGQFPVLVIGFLNTEEGLQSEVKLAEHGG